MPRKPEDTEVFVSLREKINRKGAETAEKYLGVLCDSAVKMFREAKLFRVFRISVAINKAAKQLQIQMETLPDFRFNPKSAIANPQWGWRYLV